MHLTDYLDILFERRRSTPRTPAPPMFRCPFCMTTWGEWSDQGLAAYYSGHPRYPTSRNPPLHYTVCDACSAVRHLVARMDDEKQRLADLRHTDTLFPGNRMIQEQIRVHSVTLAALVRELEDLRGIGSGAQDDPDV